MAPENFQDLVTDPDGRWPLVNTARLQPGLGSSRQGFRQGLPSHNGRCRGQVQTYACGQNPDRDVHGQHRDPSSTARQPTTLHLAGNVQTPCAGPLQRHPPVRICQGQVPGRRPVVRCGLSPCQPRHPPRMYGVVTADFLLGYRALCCPGDPTLDPGFIVLFLSCRRCNSIPGYTGPPLGTRRVRGGYGQLRADT